MPTHTPRLQLPVPALNEVADENVAISGITDILDKAVMFRQDNEANLPAAASVPPGTLFIAVDSQKAFLSTNAGNPNANSSTAWVPIPGQGAVVNTSLSTALAQTIAQPGDLRDTAVPVGASDPPGWLYCDGRAIGRTGAFAALFAAIGTTHGNGDGSTTFNIPDYRSRATIGADNMGTAAGASNRMPNNPTTLGASGGSEQTTLTAAQSGLPSHNHIQNAHTHVASADSQINVFVPTVNPGGSVTSARPGSITDGFVPLTLPGWGMAALLHSHNITVNNTTPTNIANAAAPASSPHSNVQPYACVNKKIKT